MRAFITNASVHAVRADLPLRTSETEFVRQSRRYLSDVYCL